MQYSIFFKNINEIIKNTWYIRNNYLSKLEAYDKSNIIKVITWIRRVWKSFILKQYIEKLIESWFNKNNIFYLHLEDYKLWENPDLNLLSEIFDYFIENIYSWGDFYIFLDEIQNVQSWEKFVRTINEKYSEKAHIFITWSNSNLLSSELSTLLTWRFIELQVFPFSFQEYLEFNKLDIKSNLDTNKIRYFEDYIKYWSLPEILKIEDTYTKINYIKTLIESILYKDIVIRYRLRKTRFLSSLLKFSFSNTCTILSINSILKYLKQEIKSLDYETVDNYISYLENTFLLNSLEWIDIKTKSILKSNKKYYAYDLGFRSIFSNNQDIEKTLENLVFIELKRRWYSINLLHWRNSEIDFIAEKNNIKSYFQVSYTIKAKDTYLREIKPLLLQKDNYTKYILTLDNTESEDRWIYIKNIINWLLEE